MEEKYNWEVPEVNLDLRDPQYKGNSAQAIQQLNDQIITFLKRTDITNLQRSIYSAVYNALNYYKEVSYSPSAEFSTEDNFLYYTLNELNADYKYLKKYNAMYPNDPPVIRMDARIKSPISFIEKTKDKIEKYLIDGRDLTHLNESLRDLIGAQIIVNPPQEIKAKGKQAEIDFLNMIYLDWMNFHGTNIEDNSQSEHKYHFVKVNTSYDPTKLQKLKDRPKEEGFLPGVLKKIFRPVTRIKEMNDPEIDSVTKDYITWPKKRGYQALHTCVIPNYSKKIAHPYALPESIVKKPATYDYYIEYHFQTEEQYKNATKGISSHNKYKPHEKIYHRLAVPTYISVDDPEIMDIEDSKNYQLKDILRPRNFAECLKKFYGMSFFDMFGIKLKTLKLNYPSYINDVLALKKKAVFDRRSNTYTFEDYRAPLVGTVEDLTDIKTQIYENPREVEEIMIQNGLTFYPKIFIMETAASRAKQTKEEALKQEQAFLEQLDDDAIKNI